MLFLILISTWSTIFPHNVIFTKLADRPYEIEGIPDGEPVEAFFYPLHLVTRVFLIMLY